MSYVTYTELVERFGYGAAKDLLKCIETLAQIQNDIVDMDSEKRFQKALEALNATSGAAHN